MKEEIKKKKKKKKKTHKLTIHKHKNSIKYISLRNNGCFTGKNIQKFFSWIFFFFFFFFLDWMGIGLDENLLFTNFIYFVGFLELFTNTIYLFYGLMISTQ